MRARFYPVFQLFYAILRLCRRITHPGTWEPRSVITDQTGTVLFEGTPEEAATWMDSLDPAPGYTLWCKTTFFRDRAEKR